MKERPIIFSGPMVRAILAGVKTQTRRPVKVNADRYEGLVTGTVPQERDRLGTYCFFRDEEGKSVYVQSPYGGQGGRLWVRETFAGDDLCGWVYRADHPDADIKAGDLDDGEQSLRRWTPSIHMPRIACRLTLDVVAVRVERLQDISQADAIAEGVHHQPRLLAPNGARILYVQLWQSLNAKRGHGWETNPWVWVIEFRREK